MHQGIPSGFKQNMMIMAFIEHWERLKWPSSISPWHIILDGMQPLASWIESLRPIRVLRRSQRKYRSDGLWWLATEDHVYCLFCLLQKLRVPFIAVLVSESARDPFHPTILILHQYATVFSFRRTALLALWHSTGRMRFGHLRIGDELPGLFLDVSTVGHCGATGRLAPSQSEAGDSWDRFLQRGERSQQDYSRRATNRARRQGHAGPVVVFCTLKNRYMLHWPSTKQLANGSMFICVLIIIDHYWSTILTILYNTDILATITYLTTYWHTTDIQNLIWLGDWASWAEVLRQNLRYFHGVPGRLCNFGLFEAIGRAPWPLGSQHVL